MNRRFVVVVVASLSICTGGLAHDWFSPTRVSVRTGMLLHRDYSAVTMVTSSNGDVRIQSDTSADGKTTSVQLFLVGGRILLAKGGEITPGAEIDVIDAPVLKVQLALKLLARAIPSGASAVRSVRPIQISELKEPIEVSTTSASGQYQPPWSLRGTVKRESGTRVSFSLIFGFKDAPQPITISGFWEQTKPAPVFSDSLSVVGWRSFTIGPYSKQDAGGTIYDYGAQEMSRQFKTLGEARAEAKKRGDA